MLRRIVTTLGAFVSAVLGFAALQITGLTPSTEASLPALLLGLAVLVVCVSSYRSGFLAEKTT